MTLFLCIHCDYLNFPCWFFSFSFDQEFNLSTVSNISNIYEIFTIRSQLQIYVLIKLEADGGQLESLCYFDHRAQFWYVNLKLFYVFTSNFKNSVK
jgi:hypothetical protein